ncbi:MAG: AgmX/PglI C-terminal domain-containing protein [Sandaracinaceae bacterium]
MTQHRAKTAALLAYAEGLLSDAGVRRIEAHLDGCDVCQQELLAIQLYDRMVDDVNETEVPAVDFARMELTLAREAKRVSQEIAKKQEPKSAWLPWAVGALAMAAAIGLFFSGTLTPTAEIAETAPTPAPRPIAVPAPVEAAELTPQLTMAAGVVRRASDEAPLGAGQSLREGDRLHVEGEAHVRLDEGLGFVVGAPRGGSADEARTVVELARADVEGVRLALVEGRLDSTVESDDRLVEGWRHDSAFVVLAGRYEVRARGPVQFVTSYVDGELTVGAHAGRLAIHRDGNEVARLEAPERWSSGPAGSLGPVGVRTVRGLGAALEPSEATVVTLSHPELVRWSLDGVEVNHPGPVQLRVRNGSHRVTGWTLAGASFEHTFDAVGGSAMVDEGEIRVTAPPRMRAGHLEPHVIASVVARGQRSFQQCWRRSLRENTESQQGTLRVTIGSLGDVSRVRVSGLQGRELRECIANYAERWEFPPPGGPVTFNQPLRFSPSM